MFCFDGNIKAAADDSRQLSGNFIRQWFYFNPKSG